MTASAIVPFLVSQQIRHNQNLRRIDEEYREKNIEKENYLIKNENENNKTLIDLESRLKIQEYLNKELKFIIGKIVENKQSGLEEFKFYLEVKEPLWKEKIETRPILQIVEEDRIFEKPFFFDN